MIADAVDAVPPRPALPPPWSARPLVLGLVLGVGAAFAASQVGSPDGVVRWVLRGYVLLFAFPLLMASVLTGIATLLAAILVALAAGPRLLGRPSGLGDVLPELLWLGPSMIPGYVRALARVRKPVLWGVIAGLGVGAVAVWATWLRGVPVPV